MIIAALDTTLLIIATFASLIAIGCALRLSYRLGQVKNEAANTREESKQYREHVARQRVHLLDAIAECVIMVDSRQRVVLANKNARALFRAPELEGRDLLSVVLDRQLADVLEAGLGSNEESRSSIVLSGNATRQLLPDHTNGETAWEIDIAPLSGYEQDITHRVLIRNVTSAHIAEQVRKDFVANASHELRTPLAIIRGYLETFLEPDGLDDIAMARRQLEIMNRHSDRIGRIVEDMLVISRLESGAASAISESDFSLADCLSDIAERLEPVVRAASAKLIIKVDPPDVQLHADPFYIAQVLFNLIENAIKQNAERRVTVDVLAVQDDEGDTVITVTDDGSGIPSADLPFIFRRFYRVQKDHSQNKIKGTGLGLSIVKRAIEAHNGTVEVTSKPGVATTFTVTLPSTK